MAYSREPRDPGDCQSDDSPEELHIPERPGPGGTGAEAEYLKSLVDSRAKVTVVLTTGERLRGRIRYYDRECFSLGQLGAGPNLFLRKSEVHSIVED
jgi:hypothetical protein